MKEIVTDKKTLHQISLITTHEEVERLGLVKQLREANKTAWTKGAGLAAIQIGIPLRFSWYVLPNKKEYTLLNPVIIEKWGSDTKSEGCLSIPNYYQEVTRGWTIKYSNNGKIKTISGFEARIIQHEIDHMDGKLITDNP
jgi:peptide deformylase